MRTSFAKKEKALPCISDYQLTEPWQNTNSGNARWSFARKDGKEYFIKEFLSPSCPSTGEMSQAAIAAKKAVCFRFFQQKKELYRRIEQSSNGNIVTIDEFFLFGTKYYVTTEKINITRAQIESIAKAPAEKKLLLLKILANCLQRLHENGVVHADLKPNNILIKESDTGNFIAKIIDFDSSFLAGHQPDSEEVQGDLPYLAPETCRYMFGEDVTLTQKVDVFAAGLLFHQYFTGQLPAFSSGYDAAHEALLEGESLRLSDALPPDLHALIASMLALDPDDRPDMAEVFRRLSDPRPAPKPDPDPPVPPKPEPEQKKDPIDIKSLWHVPTGF